MTEPSVATDKRKRRAVSSNLPTEVQGFDESFAGIKWNKVSLLESLFLIALTWIGLVWMESQCLAGNLIAGRDRLRLLGSM